MTKILLIEDELAIRDEVQDWLLFEGYEVDGAENGRVGIELAHQRHPDIILCDIAMPEMNGHEVLLEIRSNPSLSQTIFIFVTAAADRQARRVGMNLGADDYLTKPFTRAELLDAIESQLQKKALLNKHIAEQVQALNQAYRQEQDKYLTKSRLFAMFSHDFRNPLSLILLSTDMLYLGEQIPLSKRRQRQYDRIHGSVYQLQQMLEDMAVTAEMEKSLLKFKPEPTVITVLVETIVDEFRLIDYGQHTITYRSSLSDEVLIDPKLVRRIFSNLLSNALKYSPIGTEVAVNLYQKAGSIYLEVEDEGVGISMQDLERLYEPFYRAEKTRHINGSGLGLAIVKECAECHQGQVTVKSVVDQGTRFAVELPLVLAPAS